MNIILFDMDHTLVSEDTMSLWGKFLDLKGIRNEIDRQKRLKLDEDYQQLRLNFHESYEHELSIINRIHPTTRNLWRQEFFEDHLRHRISKKGLHLIEEHKNEPNTLILLTTGSLSFIATTVAQHIGVHDCIATDEETIEEKFTGKIIGEPNLGKGKVIRFQQYLQNNHLQSTSTTLYSDSIYDLPLFSIVNKAIAVDPDEHLKKIAMERRWEIISLRNAL
jgi:HAD superfamily hydrolase (TIGR01490 family)